jgi:hypothetical protein
MIYPHDYIDYIRSYTDDIMTLSRIDTKYKKISLLCFDYLMEIISVSDYTYDNIWKISTKPSNQPFIRFIETKQKMNELEKTVISFITENLNLHQTV